MIMAVVALLKNKPKPTDADIDDAITNICRCGTYQRVRAAIRSEPFQPPSTAGENSQLSAIAADIPPTSSLTNFRLLIYPGTQVATSRCINLHLIDAPKEEEE
jgi:[2Fe-2S] binding domain